MICPNCKNNIPDKVVFCPVCGGSTGVVPQPPIPQHGAVANPSVQVTYGAKESEQPQQNQTQAQPTQSQPVQPDYTAGTQAVQQPAAYPGYTANAQIPQQGYNYAPANGYTSLNGQMYNVPQQTHAKKKMGPGAIIGIVIGGIFGFILLLCLLVGLFSAGGSDGGYSGGGSSGGYDAPYSDNDDEIIDFELSGTYDDEGREIVWDEYGNEIGYVYEGKVYMPVDDDYYVVCDKDGKIIGRTGDPEDEDSPFSDDDEDDEEDKGAGDDANLPPINSPDKPENDIKNNNNKNTTQSNGNNSSGKGNSAGGNSSSGGSANTAHVDYDVTVFVDTIFEEAKLHETAFVEACRSGDYGNMPMGVFEKETTVIRLDDSYQSSASSYMTEDEYNKAKQSAPYSHCSVYNKSAVEKKIKKIWGSEVTVNDFLNEGEFVSSKGYIVKYDSDGYGDGAEVYHNAIDSQVNGDTIIVKVNLIGYSWYDGALWDATSSGEDLGNIGAENSPSSFRDAVERGSVDESKLGTITIYLKNTSDGLKLDRIQ